MLRFYLHSKFIASTILSLVHSLHGSSWFFFLFSSFYTRHLDKQKGNHGNRFEIIAFLNWNTWRFLCFPFFGTRAGCTLPLCLPGRPRHAQELLSCSLKLEFLDFDWVASHFHTIGFQIIFLVCGNEVAKNLDKSCIQRIIRLRCNSFFFAV